MKFFFQDIALVGELTIKDCAYHFGWIHGMTDKEIEAKYNFLESLLDLPSRNVYVKNLRWVYCWISIIFEIVVSDLLK